MAGCQSGSVVVFDNLDASVKAPSTVSILDIFHSVFLMPSNPLQNFPVCLVVVVTLPKGATVTAPVTEDQANSPDYVPQAAATVSKSIKFQTELAVPKLPSMAARTLARLLYPEGTHSHAVFFFHLISIHCVHIHTPS